MFLKLYILEMYSCLFFIISIQMAFYMHHFAKKRKADFDPCVLCRGKAVMEGTVLEVVFLLDVLEDTTLL